ncbi:hypothetical protein [Actinophytocola xanthii]|uniref:Polymerase nucleotidyl transferase domain-containing protein n=1 Tax=Actinophytocola xanthii TaxID=1912961 RepID=A0A1Q8CNK0_9PSEU|nr:hypothetical protein [Actinophytocola xanthii]OLF15942.1 hypothetical protein BU204_18715 [Actinophytocola xanthii]
MILSHDHLQHLLTLATEGIDVPEGTAAVIEGSIAEGFGNDSSDVDFLLLEAGDHDFPTMPTIVFVEGRRVEVRVRSVRQAEELARAVAGSARSGPRGVAGIPEDSLNRVQRLVRAVPLRNPSSLKAVRDILPEDELARIVVVWFRQRARQSARYATALAGLGAVDRAASWARTALIQGAKSWVAERGESYLERKWISQQLARVDGSAPVRRMLETAERSDLPPEQYVRHCVGSLPELGVDGAPLDPARVLLARVRGVTTWPLGRHLHLLRGQDVFTLNEKAAHVWRSLRFDTPLPEVVTGDAGEVIAEFLRVGLLRLRWRGGGLVRGYAVASPPPTARRPILSLHGAPVTEHDPFVTLVPLAARRFAEAGMSLVWANIMVENAREDAEGAARRRQWPVVETTSRRMFRQACLAVLSAFGVSPQPPAEESLDWLSRLPELPRPIAESARAVEFRVANADQAARLLTDLEDLVTAMRAAVGVELFPSSFASIAEWRSTLDIGYDWTRLGGYLNAAFPIQEAQDLIATAGRQPHGSGG